MNDINNYARNNLGENAMKVLPTHIVSVGGLVYNKKNEILLVKNKRRGWEFPGGQVENGETLTEALIREIKEESGIKIKVLKMVGIYSKVTPHEGYNGVKIVPTQVNIDFICKYISGKLMLSDETTDYGWFKKDGIKGMITNKIYQIRIKTMLEENVYIKYLAYNNEYKILERGRL
jgi:8-oxo-dGTP diphosphatase